MKDFWNNKKTLVTGGASFIGSHLVDRLIKLNAHVRVVDDLSSGRIENIQDHINSGIVDFIRGDLCEEKIIHAALKDVDYVFHLAADHGGRGYVDLHQAACAGNLLLDGIVFRTAYKLGIKKIIYASSGCVYPNHLQTDPNQKFLLTEDMVKPPYDADNLYGWAKLMGELTLKAYYQDYGLPSVSCRFFTVFGERGLENHAVIAMIARAFVKQDPFIIWGTGNQVRNWTYVSDIIDGILLAGQHINDGTALNLGTSERITVLEAAKEILTYTAHKAGIETKPDMPTGPLNRVADNKLAARLLGWQPKVKFRDGLHRTIDWYFNTKKPEEVATILEQKLTER